MEEFQKMKRVQESSKAKDDSVGRLPEGETACVLFTYWKLIKLASFCFLATTILEQSGVIKSEITEKRIE